ncbi:uncharacterized protein METZ01_LOCUS492805, partial [marine metagenome]
VASLVGEAGRIETHRGRSLGPHQTGVGNGRKLAAPTGLRSGFGAFPGCHRPFVAWRRLGDSMPPIPIQKMRFLSPSEIEDLAEAITPHFELLIRFSAQTGLRIGEIAGLQGGDYHSGRQTVSVKRQLLKDTVPPVYGDPKTRAGVRTLTLTPALAERIESLSVIGSAPMFTSL